VGTTEQQELRTRMFARVLGPFFVIFAATTVARASDMRKLLSDFEANSAWPWVTGGFLLLLSSSRFISTGEVQLQSPYPWWAGSSRSAR
jgi:hypothetical protein